MGSCLSILRLHLKWLTSSTPTHDPPGPAASGTPPECAGQGQAKEETSGAGDQPQDISGPLVSKDENEEMGILKHDTQTLAISNPLSDCTGHGKSKEEPTGACDQLQHVSYPMHLADKIEGMDMDNIQYAEQASAISNAPLGYAVQELGHEEIPGVSEELQHFPLGSKENEEIIITTIQATDVALGLRRLPAGFYVVLYHNDLEWRTENKPSSVNNKVIEWSDPIPMSSDLSAAVRLEIYASFEFQPMLGAGEQLRRLTTTVGQLLDRSAKDAPFPFSPKDGDVMSPCSSISVTVRRQKYKSSDPSGSRIFGQHWSNPIPQGELEDATNEGHSALSRYRKHGEKRDLEHSIHYFEHALELCLRDHPCRAAAQSNLAIAKFILSQVGDADAALEAAFRLHRDALAARPTGHPDRPLTLIQMASVHFARLQRRRDHVGEASGEDAEALLRDAVKLSATESYERQAATLLLQLCAGHRGGRVQSDSQSCKVQELAPSLADEDPWNLSASLMKQFKQFGDLADLQRAITILEGLVESTSSGGRDYNVALGNLGVALWYRFERLGQLSDLKYAILRMRSAICITPDGHPDKPGYLNNLGNSFQTRFERLGKLNDLEGAISTQRNAIHLTPDGHPDKPGYLNNLGTSFQARFKRLGRLNDLEDAILTQRDAVRLTPDGNPLKPLRLNNLGNCFQTRFERLAQLDDLEDAISRKKDAVRLTPDGHPHKPGYLNNLGISLQTRFERLGQLCDLEDAISKKRDAVRLIPDDHPHKPMFLSNLGTSSQTRFQRLGQLNDLEDAISRKRDAVDLTPDRHPRKPMYLSNLGNAFQTRFERLGQLSDLEDAISRKRDAVRLTPDGHPRKPIHLMNLGNSFQTRFERLGQLSDLENAISTQRNAVSLIPDGHPDKPVYLSSLGNSLKTRFERLGQLSDLEDAISRMRDAVDLTPNCHPDKPLRLNNLGISFRTRFQRLRQLSDLEDAISRMRDAVHLTPDDHPHKPKYLNNLGNSFRTRFEHVGQLTDLEEAISIQREAVHLSPDGHPDKPIRLNNFGIFLRTRFQHLRQPSDLEDAISTQRDAVRLTPDGHPHKPKYLNNLGNTFRTSFERHGQLNDLEDAILTQRDAVRLTPHDHPGKLVRLNNLASSFTARYIHLGQLRDIERALSLSSHVALIPIGPTSVRFSAAQHWIQCARLIRHPSLLRAYSVAVSLTPQLAWIGLSLSHRYDELTRSADVVREAAAAALDAGFPETALEWLEQGRSVIWGDLFQLRSPYEQLSSTHPDLASRLHALSTQLDQASAAHERSLSTLSDENQSGVDDTAEYLRQVADTHRAFAIERDKLLQEIRRLPSFEKFLLRKPFSQLRAAAHSGPVVVLNIAETRCDALIVVAGVNRVIHVPLPNFTSQRCINIQAILKGFVRDTRTGKVARRQGVSWDHILSPLWITIVKPVLDALAFSVVPENLSRMFWCPTGPLAFLPIHAAGFYNKQYSEPGNKVFDFVVSSYVPSLATLMPPPSAANTPSSDLRLLLVPQPPTDGHAKLPGVAVELRRINYVVSKSPLACTTSEPSDGTVEEVLDLMRQADWVHFACHGIQDGVDSGLCLANRRRLTLRDIVALSRPRGGLAFLSACQTAKGDQRLSDEAIHIAAGMLFAGYGGVVGTMWSISDDVAPDVAKDVYEELLGKGPRADYREAARALHEAIQDLRRRDKPFDEWIPFIHVGL